MPTASRFFRRGVTKVWAVPTLTLTAPTLAQVNAGVELTTPRDLKTFTGFSYTTNFINAGDWASAFEGKEPGLDQAADCLLHFYLKRGITTPNPLRPVLARLTVTNIVIFDLGYAGSAPAVGDFIDIWPVISGGAPKDYSDTELAQWHVGLGPTQPPVQDIALV